ncbi:hypothetical protein THAOC_02383 [Thalassiosira oceanica]|uniref:Enoyl reductase (ER) domain-containing protein n=1 Tax=Thalassiosira oceanica TaxID=159749 RepID=K0TEQ2_THAOC|nr:hypothetical protein THAOC_02383 [Thalassiosira oceanica]|eukprot:EJK75880.1 hypothetical protein THAOC_02383 [Thalassiosira oceanica]
MRAAIRTGLLGWTISFGEQPKPEKVADTELLIKVENAAINPVDFKIPRAIGGKVVGIDVSGTVERVGSSVTDFQVGDEVFGRAIGSSGMRGSLAEYTVVSQDEVAKKPGDLPFNEAAALGVAYLTGLQSMKVGNVGEGSAVLVIGASGGCGVAGVQLAKALGAERIVGICSGKNFDFVREQVGYDALELVDYNDSELMKEFRDENKAKFDCIYDTSTGSTADENYSTSVMSMLKEEGQYVQINGGMADWVKHAAGRKTPRKTMVLTASKGRKSLEEIASLLQKAEVKPHLNIKKFDEAGVKEGFEMLKGRRTRGKIVFNIN